MSRGASVTLEFIADLAQAEQRYEAFVRKVSSPIPLNFSGQPGGAAPAGAASATFGTPGAPSTASDNGMREAFQRRSDSEKLVAEANVRLAAAVSQQAVAASQAANTIRSSATPPPTSAGPAGWPAGTSAWAAPFPVVPAVSPQNPPQPAQPPSPNQPPPGSGGGGRWGRGLARYTSAGFLLHEAASVAKAYYDEQVAERLAVSDGGQVDLMRQYEAQKGFISKVEGVPVVGQLAGLGADVIASTYGSGSEDTQRTIQRAESSETRIKAIRSAGDYREELQRRNRVLAADGAYPQAVAEADNHREAEEKKARDSRNEQVRNDRQNNQYDTSGPDKLYDSTVSEIRKGYNLTISKISKSYGTVMQRLSDEIPILAEREAGNTRTADRMTLQADIKRDIGAEDDPAKKSRIQRAGDARLRAFDATQDREDTTALVESGYRREAFQRRSIGDEVGELQSSQQARRAGILALPKDDPKRAAYLEEDTARAGAENADFERSRNLRLGALQANVAVSGLEGEGKPNAAAVESIYRKATLAAQKDFGRPDEATLELQTGYNDLQAVKQRLTQGGSAEFVPSGTYGPRGTQGGDKDDQAETLKRIDDKQQQLIDAINGLKSALTGD